MSRIVIIGMMKGEAGSPVKRVIDPRFAEQMDFSYEIPNSRKRKWGRNRLKVRIFHHGQ